MNKSKTAILMDSGCDLSEELIEYYGIKVLRLKVMYGDKMYSDGVDIDPLEVYRRFPDDIPKTSTPNMQEVMDIVDEIRSEGYEKIIAVAISSELSGTYNVMAMTLRGVEDMQTYAFDTKNISIGSGLYVLWAAKQLEEGKDFEEVTAGLERKIHDSKVFFYMDTLDYLRKGGRINPAVAVVGKVLGIKPVISCNEKGVYYTVAKIRGAKKGIGKLMEVAMEFADGKRSMIGLMNGGAPETAKQIKPLITEQAPNGEIVVDKQITATMAVHTGPGLIGIGILYTD
ncbi:MAG: DegV family protein [Butyrivibrio sp.]|nr:DegV family protein [Butyrivibrio sp.]